MTASTADLVARITAIRQRAKAELAGKVITVASRKGGEGKSREALELSWCLDAVLADLDWDLGHVSRTMGYRYEEYASAPLMDALRRGRIPRLWQRAGRPPLVPGNTELGNWRPRDADQVPALIRMWAREWQLPVVVDTHPGYGDVSRGAIDAATVVVTPVTLGTPDLNALEGHLIEISPEARARTLITPNMIEGIPPEAESVRLEELVTRWGARMSVRGIDRYRWLKTRKSPRPVTSLDPMPARCAPFAEQVAGVAEEVLDHAKLAA